MLLRVVGDETIAAATLGIPRVLKSGEVLLVVDDAGEEALRDAPGIFEKVAQQVHHNPTADLAEVSGKILTQKRVRSGKDKMLRSSYITKFKEE